MDYGQVIIGQSQFPFEPGIVMKEVADSGPLEVFLTHSGDIVYVEHFYFPTYSNGTGSSNLPKKGTTVLISWLPGKIPCYMGCLTNVSYPVAGEPGDTTETLKGDASRLPQESGENKTIGPKQQLLKFDNYGNFAITDSALSGLISNKDYGGLLLQTMQLITSTDAESSFSGIWKREDPETEEIVNSLKPKVDEEDEEEPQDYYTTKNSTLYSISRDAPKARSYYKRLAEAIMETESFRNLTLDTKDDELAEEDKTRPVIYKAEVNDINSETKTPRKNIALSSTWDSNVDVLDADRQKAFDGDSTALEAKIMDIVSRLVVYSEDTREPKQLVDVDKDGNAYINLQGALDLIADQRHTNGKLKKVSLMINQGLLKEVTNGVTIRVTGELTDQEKIEKSNEEEDPDMTDEEREEQAQEEEAMLKPRGVLGIDCSGDASIYTEGTGSFQAEKGLLLEAGTEKASDEDEDNTLATIHISASSVVNVIGTHNVNIESTNIKVEAAEVVEVTAKTVNVTASEAVNVTGETINLN